MKKDRCRITLLSGCAALLLLITGLLVHFSRVISETRQQCDGVMARFTPAIPHNDTAFTMRLHSHPTTGDWPGFGLGWTIDYRSPLAADGVTYYVNLSGEVIHAEPIEWMKAVGVQTEASAAPSTPSDGNNQ